MVMFPCSVKPLGGPHLSRLHNKSVEVTLRSVFTISRSLCTHLVVWPYIGKIDE